jgi:hypothetical protein
MFRWSWRKLIFFKLHKDEVDMLFVGSSHIFQGFTPKVFDETLPPGTNQVNRDAFAQLARDFAARNIALSGGNSCDYKRFRRRTGAPQYTALRIR